ncbi:MAG: hypothetical protein ACO1O3_22320 [Sphingobium sp.]
MSNVPSVRRLSLLPLLAIPLWLTGCGKPEPRSADSRDAVADYAAVEDAAEAPRVTARRSE